MSDMLVDGTDGLAGVDAGGLALGDTGEGEFGDVDGAAGVGAAVLARADGLAEEEGGAVVADGVGGTGGTAGSACAILPPATTASIAAMVTAFAARPCQPACRFECCCMKAANPSP
ncbi:hypothetical protein [Nocardia sp. NPDC051570]|uniref:hypothetical protein n=1 Tax=Nocardia sp. NPDC051570 TaxID=3364324 RepID=UPI0037B3713F